MEAGLFLGSRFWGEIIGDMGVWMGTGQARRGNPIPWGGSLDPAMGVFNSLARREGGLV